MCDSTGQCVADTTKLIADPCPSNYFDLICKPWSWYDAKGAAQAIILKLNDINGAIVNFFADYGIIDYTYVATRIFPKDDNVRIRVYLNKTGLSGMAIQLGLAEIGIILVTVASILIAIGGIYNYFWGTTDKGFTNGQFKDAEQQFLFDSIEDCAAETCSDPTLTQDQKATCIKKCVNTLLTNWKKDIKDVLYPKGDHTPLDDAVTHVQTCYDVYAASAKTTTDYQTFEDCTETEAKAGVIKDGNNTLAVYPADAAAGATATSETTTSTGCWIKSPFSSNCILGASTGKKLLILTVVGIIGYIIIKKSVKKVTS